MHHVIPIRMKPESNVIIPLCKKCHGSIHQDDVRGLIDMLYGKMIDLSMINKKLERYLKLKETERM